MSAHPHDRPMPMAARTRWSVGYQGQSIGLISPNGACTARFRLSAGYSITPYHGHVEGPGWLTLKVGPETSLALSALGFSIGTIEVDRTVRLSSRFPRWVEITRVQPVGGLPPAGNACVGQSREPPTSRRDARIEFDDRSDPREPRRRQECADVSVFHSLESRQPDRWLSASANPGPVDSGLA
jgi:hypothetical protein